MDKELPNNWVETELGNILKLKNGFAFKSEDFKDSGIPVIRISNIQNEQVKTEAAARVDPSKIKQEFIVQKGDILIAMSGATTGKYGIYNENIVAAQNQRVGNLVPHDENLTSRKFIYYLLGGLKKEIEDKAYGGAQPNISPKIIEEIIIGLPPLPEQQRIVAKLDTLFGHLDALKIRLDHIPQLLKDFRQKVLTQAVTGKLTEEWRLSFNISENSRKVKLLDVLIEKPRNGYSPQGVDYVTDVKSLSLGATTSGKFNTSKIKYLDIDKPKMDSYLWLKNGDILIQRSNSFDYVGVSAIYDGKDDDFIYPDLMMKLRVKDQTMIKYIFYQLSSKELRDYFRDNATGTAGNMPKINQGTVSDAPIILRSEKEQQEIVRRVESLFAKADQIETSYQKLKVKIEQLPQALLAKAFRGELVEQLPTDGDGRDLLEEIEKAKEKLFIKKKER
ncbi:MAG TPA: restriction endonuclease subunit S [Prolixibacteraceae bacterium]|nr:restriction endonuclease subunit S [Prolixibacteraceae bacterium]